MSATTAEANAMLNARTYTAVSLHSAFPGTIGANEILSVGYVRQTPTFATAASRQRVTTGALNFTMSNGDTVRWVCVWAGATCSWVSPNAAVPKEFVCIPSTDTFYSEAHGFLDTDKVVFWGDTVPSPLTEGDIYYVRDSAADTFKVAASSGGAVIDLTTAGGRGCQVSKISEDAYAAAGTHTIASITVGLPN